MACGDRRLGLRRKVRRTRPAFDRRTENRDEVGETARRLYQLDPPPEFLQAVPRNAGGRGIVTGTASFHNSARRFARPLVRGMEARLKVLGQEILQIEAYLPKVYEDEFVTTL